MGLLDGISDAAGDAVDTATDYTTDPIGDGLGNPVQSAGDAVEEADQAAEGWLATGRSRDAYDRVMDYDEEWHGQQDQHDLIGPSVHPFDGLDNSDDESTFQWNSPDAQNDPTNPDNWLVPPKIIAGVVVLALLAVAFGQAGEVQVGGESSA